MASWFSIRYHPSHHCFFILYLSWHHGFLPIIIQGIIVFILDNPWHHDFSSFIIHDINVFDSLAFLATWFGFSFLNIHGIMTFHPLSSRASLFFIHNFPWHRDISSIIIHIIIVFLSFFFHGIMVFLSIIIYGIIVFILDNP